MYFYVHPLVLDQSPDPAHRHNTAPSVHRDRTTPRHYRLSLRREASRPRYPLSRTRFEAPSSDQRIRLKTTRQPKRVSKLRDSAGFNGLDSQEVVAASADANG